MGNMIELILWQYFATVLGVLISLALVWTASPVVAGVFFAWLAVIIPLNLFFMTKIEKFSKKSADGLSKLRGVTVDILTNILAVAQFARRTDEVRRVAAAADEQRRLAQKSWVTSEIGLTVNSLLMGGFVISMVATAFYYWSHGTITLGQFVLIFTLTSDLIGTFVFLGPSMNRAAELYGESKEGLDEILTPYEITDYPKAEGARDQGRDDRVRPRRLRVRYARGLQTLLARHTGRRARRHRGPVGCGQDDLCFVAPPPARTCTKAQS